MEYRLAKGVPKELFIKKITELNRMFPTWKMDLSDSEVVKTLYSYIGYYADEVFENAINNYISNETMNPTIAGIKKYMPKNKISSSEEMEILRREMGEI